MNSRWIAAGLAALLSSAACGLEEEFEGCGPAESRCSLTTPHRNAHGPENAKIVLVEFADYQCPYCVRAASTVKQLLDLYPSDLKLVFKHLPLSFHARAMPAAVALECASEQGHFWPMHEKLFASGASLEDSALRTYASEVGADLAAWDTCLTSAAPKARIQADRAEAAELGVTGTPTFFINGRRLVGAQPLAEFQKIVDEELGR